MSEQVAVKKRKKRVREGASKFTPEIREKILSAIRVGVFKTSAAEYAGITYDTLRNWEVRGRNQPKSQYGEFLEELKKAAAEADVADMSLIRVAAQKDWRAAAWALGKRHPHEYGDSSKVEVSGTLTVASLLGEIEKRADADGDGNGCAPEDS